MIPSENSYSVISPDKLADSNATVVDVRTPEAYSESRLPGSVNHCVYEVAFMEEFPKAFPDKGTELVVYGDGDPFKADLAAIGRLQTLGYENLSILEGGLTRWKGEGRPTEGTGSTEVSGLSGRYTLDAERTKVRWVGRNLVNQHDGEIESISGFIELDGSGVPVAGEVMVDLTKMTCRDIEDKSLAGMLIGHLQHTDFFDVETFPEASFKLQSAQPLEGASCGQPNFLVEGTLSARGNATPLTLHALIEPVEGGIVFQSNFDFDRVELGALYGSGKLFERLGMHLVNDLVSMDVAAVFTK